MAKITASVYASHVPAIGVAQDTGKMHEPYWQPLFSGFEPSQAWLREQRPDVVFLVYNDHANAFSLDIIPTFAIGAAAEFPPADEGWGPRPVPVLDITLAGWSDGIVLTVRYGNRKLTKELTRASP